MLHIFFTTRVKLVTRTPTRSNYNNNIVRILTSQQTEQPMMTISGGSTGMYRHTPANTSNTSVYIM